MKPVVFGASVQGASHIRSETECQDSWKKRICDDGTVIMAVADGHGSKNCPYSNIGSDKAVNVFCEIMSQYAKNFVGEPEKLMTFLNREGDTKIAQAIDVEWKKCVEHEHEIKKRCIPLDENGEMIKSQIYIQYGTTLLGVMLAEDFLFAFQIGDGDIVFISADGFETVLKSDKILGVETHSLSQKDSWKKAVTTVRRIDFQEKLPTMILMSTDGFANSYLNQDEFVKTCMDYFEIVNEHGTKAVEESLKDWLSETSTFGCGDDITVLMAYYNAVEQVDDTGIEIVCESDQTFGRILI